MSVIEGLVMPFPGLWSLGQLPWPPASLCEVHSCPPLSPVDASRLSSYHLLPKCVLCIVSNHSPHIQWPAILPRDCGPKASSEERHPKSRPPGHPLRAQGREQHKGLDTARAAGWSYPCALNARTTQENRKHAPRTNADASTLGTTPNSHKGQQPKAHQW